MKAWAVSIDVARGNRQHPPGVDPAPRCTRCAPLASWRSMQFRSFISMAPVALRPVLYALCDWMDRTDARLKALEKAAGIGSGA